MATPEETLARRLAERLAQGGFAGKQDVQRWKQEAARELGLARVPSDPDLQALLPAGQTVPQLRKKPARSLSGVAVVAVMSSPAACPHGTCVFCPGGPTVGVPQSYTGFEPSTMRAIRFGYDPYQIVRSRLAVLERNGHAIDKVDLVVQGGTFPARDPGYQDWFVAMLYQACNDGPSDVPPAAPAWDDVAAADRLARLAQVQHANESARCRVVGLTVETKPDWCREEHLDRMLIHGATRVEIGLQCLDDEALRLTHRGHTLQDSRDAVRLAREAGFKVCVHMMPGLPRRRVPVESPARGAPAGAAAGLLLAGSQAEGTPTAAQPPLPRVETSPEPARWRYATDADADVADLRRLFSEPEWRPDMLKVYPTLVVREGETPLKRWWREGRYTPYDTDLAARVIAAGLEDVPPWCRIQRVDRDIPTTHVEAGVSNSNLRQFVEAQAQQRGRPLRDVRAREAGQRQQAGAPVDAARARAVLRVYEAAGGHEAFLAFEDDAADAVLGFCRIRRVAGPHRDELRHGGGCAVVRELKVFGAALPVGAPAAEGFQHQGLGTRLLAWAEALAFGPWKVQRVAVLAGPGVKDYYRRQGYTDAGPYLVRDGPRDADANEHFPLGETTALSGPDRRTEPGPRPGQPAA